MSQDLPDEMRKEDADFKRMMLTGMAMMGLIAKHGYYRTGENGSMEGLTYIDAAKDSCKYADALILELAKERDAKA